jgi:hypothetical protein
MQNNANLFNATVIGENPETAFVVEGNHLHAVEQSVADQKKDENNPKAVIPLMKEALKALVKFCQGKVEKHFLDVDWDAISDQPDEQEQLVLKIHSIFSHLSHHDRNELSSLIHHKQTTSRKNR